jgi:hypothetical protein
VRGKLKLFVKTWSVSFYVWWELMSQPLVPVVSQMKPVNALPRYLFNAHFNIILQSVLTWCTAFFFVHFVTPETHFWSVPCMNVWHAFHPVWFTDSNALWCRVYFMKLSFWPVQFRLSACCLFHHVRSKFSLCHPILKQRPSVFFLYKKRKDTVTCMCVPQCAINFLVFQASHISVIWNPAKEIR